MDRLHAQVFEREHARTPDGFRQEVCDPADCDQVGRGAGVEVARYLTGSYVTSLEMAGCSITVTAVDDAALTLWDAPVHTAALRWGV